MKALFHQTYARRASFFLLLRWAILVGSFVGKAGVVSAEDDLFTKTFVVPPSFITLETEPIRPTAQEILEHAGIEFPLSTTAVYLPDTSKLIVRNTREQIALIEELVESIRREAEKLIHFTVDEYWFKEFPESLEKPSVENIISESIGPRSIDDRASLIHELEKPREAEDDGVVSRHLIGVYTKSRIQEITSAWGGSYAISGQARSYALVLRSGGYGLAEDGLSRYGFGGVAGPDNATIDLELLIPPSGGVLGEGCADLQVTIGDNRSILYAEELEEEGYRILIVTAQLIDPAGRPLNSKPEDGEPNLNGE